MVKIVSSILIFCTVSMAANGGNQVITLVKNPGLIQINNPSQFERVYAISDVHGMYDKLVQLLLSTGLIQGKSQGFNWAKGKALFVVIGDSVDKGEDSLKVLEFWMALKQKIEAAGGKFIHTLGNHEAGFLANPNNKKAEAFKAELTRKRITFIQFINSPSGMFIRSMPICAGIGKWLFCHSGYINRKLNFQEFVQKAESPKSPPEHFANDIFSADDSILEKKDWWQLKSGREYNLKELEKWGYYGLIFGHQDKAFGAPEFIISDETQRMIKVETGMNPEKIPSRPGKILEILNPADMINPQPLKLRALTTIKDEDVLILKKDSKN